jgi:septal ring factor EnvC (AmiA/AmiB activator)
MDSSPVNPPLPFPDAQLDQMAEQLGEQEERYNGMAKSRKKLEAEMEAMRRQVSDMDANIRRQEGEKGAKDTQIHSLQVLLIQEDGKDFGMEFVMFFRTRSPPLTRQSRG